MQEPRETWQDRAITVGLVVQQSVTKTTDLVVAAGPDTMSGRAKKARQHGKPIITEEAFKAMINQLSQ